MPEEFPPPPDPRWPRLLSLAVHEFRTPVTVVAGYIRMLLKERAGPLSDDQRRLLQEAEKSCARLSALTAEMSDLANLEAGTAPFNRSPLPIAALVDEAIAGLPPLPDREITIRLDDKAAGARVEADAVRLRTAVAAVLAALRRELINSAELIVRLRFDRGDGQALLRVTVADPGHIDAIDGAGPAELGLFDEWRGGCGLSLAIARRIITAHGGRVWSPAADTKASAVLVVPQAAAERASG